MLIRQTGRYIIPKNSNINRGTDKIYERRVKTAALHANSHPHSSWNPALLWSVPLTLFSHGLLRSPDFETMWRQWNIFPSTRATSSQSGVASSPETALCCAASDKWGIMHHVTWTIRTDLQYHQQNKSAHPEITKLNLFPYFLTVRINSCETLCCEIADHSGRAVYGVNRLRSLESWDRGL
jgi:hypothetical protein